MSYIPVCDTTLDSSGDCPGGFSSVWYEPYTLQSFYDGLGHIILSLLPSVSLVVALMIGYWLIVSFMLKR